MDRRTLRGGTLRKGVLLNVISKVGWVVNRDARSRAARNTNSRVGGRRFISAALHPPAKRLWSGIVE